MMLEKSKAFGGYSVNDIQKAKEFYKDVLGLDVRDNSMGIIELHLDGSTPMILYPKPNHEPATFTVLNFPVEDIESTVKALKSKGVAFESYDSKYLKTGEDNISRGNGPTIAWFKDPAGNILSVIQS